MERLLAGYGRARGLTALLLPVLFVGVSGCTVVEMHNDVADRQTRVSEKQQQLGNLRATQSDLAAESDRLKDDLQQRELSASELQARLDELVRLNEAAQVSSAQQRAQQEERHRQLQAISQQAQTLQHDTSLSEQEKQKKLDALKAKTRELLNILLAG